MVEKRSIRYTNLFGQSRVYQISDIKRESTIGGRGRQLIFQKGRSLCMLILRTMKKQ